MSFFCPQVSGLLTFATSIPPLNVVISRQMRARGEQSSSRFEQFLRTIYYAVHFIDGPGATIVAIYISDNLSDEEYQLIPQANDRCLTLVLYSITQECADMLVPKIQRAKQQWANDLFICGLCDVKVAYDRPNDTFSPPTWNLGRDELSAFQRAFKNCYERVPYNPEKAEAGFNIVWSEQELTDFMEKTPNLPVRYCMNVDAERHVEFDHPPKRLSAKEKKAQEEVRYQERIAILQSNLQKKLDMFDTPVLADLPRGSEPWYPFSMSKTGPRSNERPTTGLAPNPTGSTLWVTSDFYRYNDVRPKPKIQPQNGPKTEAQTQTLAAVQAQVQTHVQTQEPHIITMNRGIPSTISDAQSQTTPSSLPDITLSYSTVASSAPPSISRLQWAGAWAEARAEVQKRNRAKSFLDACGAPLLAGSLTHRSSLLKQFESPED